MKRLAAINPWTITAFGLTLLIGLGFFKEDWLDELSLFFQTMMAGSLEQGGKGILDFMLNNRKLLATSCISGLYAAVTGALTYWLTRSIFWTGIAGFVYIALMVVSLLIYLAGILTSNSQQWWNTAQDIKMLLQSPFIWVLISGIYNWFRVKNNPGPAENGASK
jgi:hypothetical protein